MKRIITLFFAFATISFSFAQSNAEVKQAKRSAKTTITSQQEAAAEPRMVDCIWESDFTDASVWDLDHDSSDCSLDWEITSSANSLDCGGFYPIPTIDSDDGFYAMLDSDEYGGEEGGTETEDSWLTTANSIDCSSLDNVVVEIDTWYQSYNSEKCFIVVSTDGSFPTDLTPATEHDPSLGIYEIFPDISGEVQANTGNPHTRRINISESAGGQSEVWVRFNWTGTWGYAWFIDRVCIAEQPANDIALNYGVVSHNSTGEEYGRVPTSQIVDDVECAGSVFNFGSSDQSNITLTMEVEDDYGTNVASETFGEDEMYGYDAEGYLDLSETISGPVATDEYVYLTDGVDMGGWPAGKYIATFEASSDEDYVGGEYFTDNTAVREFEFTEGVYSTDGIGVYDSPDISRMGTGNFTDAADGFMMFAYYDIAAETEFTGVEILLDSYDWGNSFTTPATVSGGECVVTIRDTTLISDESFDPNDIIASSDFYIVEQTDVDNGFMTIPFPEAVTLSPDAYYIGIEMYSNDNENDIFILDDETVPQPYYMSMIYIPNDQIYSNGNATAIRMLTGNSTGTTGLEESVYDFNVYPNPSKGAVNIELNEPGSYLVQINDIVGKLVSENIIDSNTTINLQNLDKGIYFVNVSNDEIKHVTKLIVE
tara:strand:+ start:810 stop:2768 length:1959 start_codon:yes stop_codon:yes gene_type:complete